MFGTIRRHQKWLWAVIGGLTIISFAVFGPTNTRMGNALKREGNFGILAGKPITREEYFDTLHEIALDTYRKTQQWPAANSPDTIRQTYMRLFLIQKEKELGVRISSEAAAVFAHNLLGPGSLDEFTEKVLKPQGMDETDFDRYLHHELGIEQLGMAIGVTGRLVTPQEAETLYRLEHQDMESFLVYFSASNFLSSVQISPAAIGQFYTNQLANYRVPEQVQVNYVKFNVTNYFVAAQAALTNLNQMLDAAVQKFGTNLFRGAKTPEESRANIRVEIIREHAIVDAHRAASVFAGTLDELKPHTLDLFEKLAATNNLAVQTTAPFDREYGPQDITVPPAFTQKAFGLAADDLFGGPIVAEDGVYEIALKQRIPSETPSLAKIEDKVTADYRFANAVILAQQNAIKFGNLATNGLAAGKSFADICAAAGAKPEPLPHFSLSTRSLNEDLENRISFGQLKQVAFGTPPGQISAPANVRDRGAFLVYVSKLLPADETRMKTEFPEFLTYMREVRQNDSFNQWFNAEIHQDPDFLQYVNRISEETLKNAGTRGPKS